MGNGKSCNKADAKDSSHNRIGIFRIPTSLASVPWADWLRISYYGHC
jgi:hypothetical protein